MVDSGLVSCRDTGPKQVAALPFSDAVAGIASRHLACANWGHDGDYAVCARTSETSGTEPSARDQALRDAEDDGGRWSLEPDVDLLAILSL